ncbi:MAG: hypothetical protein J6Y64_08165 [Ruminococcus sp.]|nr:hypothetical protein [Ruminococcus sp.]
MNNKTTKYRITACLICLSCLVCTVNCGSKPENEAISTSSEKISEASSGSGISDEEKPDFELSFPEEPTEFEIPELSDEIPAEAVTKVTTTEFRGGEIESCVITYRDERDNNLLRFIYDEDTGETTVSQNVSYEYNENGDIICQNELTQYGVDEYYSEYDDKNRMISHKSYEEGLLSWEQEFEYDEYDNQIIEKTVYYSNETGEVLAESVIDRSDCDYDDQGHMLTVREQNKKGELSKTYTYTYDSEGRVLTELMIKENYDPENSDWKTQEIKSEYDPVCGKESRMEKIHYADDGSVISRDLYEREFDSSGRVTHVTKTYKNDETETVTEISYEYEEL